MIETPQDADNWTGCIVIFAIIMIIIAVIFMGAAQ